MGTTKSRGRKSWPPIKAKFLEAYRDTWEEAKRVKQVATFYDRLTAAFIARFGYDLPLYTDPSEDAGEDILELVEGEKIPGLAGLSEEAQEERGKQFDGLRTVRRRSLFNIYPNIASTTRSLPCGATTIFAKYTTMPFKTKQTPSSGS